jgi:hypothetical protein
MTTNTTNATFQLSPASATQAQAIRNCNALGGQLASFLSQTEQQEVRGRGAWPCMALHQQGDCIRGALHHRLSA